MGLGLRDTVVLSKEGKEGKEGKGGKGGSSMDWRLGLELGLGGWGRGKYPLFELGVSQGLGPGSALFSKRAICETLWLRDSCSRVFR